MSKRDEQRQEEIAAITGYVREMAQEIVQLVESFPEEGHLGTWRSFRNDVVRALVSIRSSIERDNARRAGKGGQL